eukprot:615145_1
MTDMFSGLHLLVILVVTIRIMSSEWIQGNATLPRIGSGWAAGSYNNSTFILGGDWDPTQIIEYQHQHNKFIDRGQTALNTAIDHIWGSQFYVQKEEKIYMVIDGFDSFTVFDMNSLQLTHQWQSIAFPHVQTDVCLAASDHHLFVTGGSKNTWSTWLDTLQMLSLSSYEWVRNAPSMNHPRARHACVVHKDRLWVFSGWIGTSSNVTTYERINITNISQNEWVDVPPLHDPRYLSVAIASGDYIFVMGGYRNKEVEYKDDVFIFDVTTEQFYESPDKLLYGVAIPGVTLANGNIYLFGGYDSSGFATNRFMYYPLLSTLTTDPSKPPTHTTEARTNHTSPVPSTHVPSHSPIIELRTSDPSTRTSMVPTSTTAEDLTATHLTQSQSGPPTKTPTHNPTTANMKTTVIATSITMFDTAHKPIITASNWMISNAIYIVIPLVSALLIFLCILMVIRRNKMADEADKPDVDDNEDEKHEETQGRYVDKHDVKMAYTYEGPYRNNNNISNMRNGNNGVKIWNDGVQLVNMLYSTSNGSKIADKQTNIENEKELEVVETMV